MTQFKKSTRARVRFIQRPSCRNVSAAAATDVIDDVTGQTEKDSVDAGFCGEPFADHDELLSSLSPLLFSMKLCGLYFHRQDGHQRRAEDPECSVATRTRISWSGLRIYATSAIILVWLNVIRLFSLFHEGDHFSADLLMKMTILAGFSVAAIMYTACYYACHTGKLYKVLVTLPVTCDCVAGARRFAIKVIAVGWIVTVVILSVMAYIGGTNNEKHDYTLAPFVTYIRVPKHVITTARLCGYLPYIFVFPGTVICCAMNMVIVHILYHEFKKLKNNFRRALDSRGHFNGDLSSFRRRRRSTN